MRRLHVLAGAGALSLSVLAAPAAATRLVDCGSGADLQLAIDAATPGDTLRVKGRCIGHFLIDRDLTLTGRGRNPTLDGGGSGTTLTVPFGPGGYTTPGPTVTLRGLRVTGGEVGIESHGSLVVRHSSIDHNGLGVRVSLEVSVWGGLTLTDSVVQRNATTGIDNRSQWPGLVVRDSLIARNGSAGIVNRDQSPTTVRRTTIRGNGGAGIDSSGSVRVERSYIRGNHGGGIVAGDYLTMSRSVVVDNDTAGDGDGLFLSADRGGPGLQYWISDSVIRDNTAAGSGGGIHVQHAVGVTLSLDHVTIRRNTAGTDGGGLFLAGLSEASLTAVVFSNNTPNDCTGC